MTTRLARSAWLSRFAHYQASLRGSLWFIPGVMALAAVALALFMLRVDASWLPRWAIESGWIYSRSAGGARELLSTVATSMITIAGLVFSILVVALQLASSQFGPRVLRNYMRDRGSQFVLGTFIATFLYCLMVMRTIGQIDGDEPQLAVTVAVALSIVSLGVLIYFLHHSAASIHAPNVIATVSRELHGAIDRMYPSRMGQPADGRAANALPAVMHDAGVNAVRDGYLQRVDGNALLAVAERAGVVLQVLRRPGDFALEGDPLLTVSSTRGLPPEDQATAAAAFIIGSRRTAEQDIEFCFQQLVQVALRALSPAYNDPLTAAACVDRIGGAFHHLLGRHEPPAVRVDHHGHPRVIAAPVPVHELIDRVFTPVIESASGSSIVCRSLAHSLSTIAPRATTAPARQALAVAVRNLQQQLESLQSASLRHTLRSDCTSTLRHLGAAE